MARQLGRKGPVEGERRNIGGVIREQQFRNGAPRRLLQRQEITTVQQVNQTRTGVRQVMVPQVVRNSLGDRVLNVAFIPSLEVEQLTLQVQDLNLIQDYLLLII